MLGPMIQPAIPDSPRFRRLNLSAGLASVGVAVTLVLLKLWALIATGALSVAASLADNALDVMMSVAALAAIAYAARPADSDHAFGHSSAEDLSALVQSALVLVSAGIIAAMAVNRLLAEDAIAPQAEGAGIIVMVIAVVLTGALVLWQRYVAKATGNRVVAADSLHYLGDLLPTSGVLVALAASRWGGYARLDAVIALLAAFWLARSGVKIGRGAWDALMDHAAPPEVLRDQWGSVITGPEVLAEGGRRAWLGAPGTEPTLLETSVPGCFAVGDARRGSVKRVASAVGEGSVVISSVHKHLGPIAGG